MAITLALTFWILTAAIDDIIREKFDAPKDDEIPECLFTARELADNKAHRATALRQHGPVKVLCLLTPEMGGAYRVVDLGQPIAAEPAKTPAQANAG